MSESSFTGTIKNFSPKSSEDYYGILIDNGKEEKWLNGKGDPNESWSKGDKVKVKANMDEFIEIQQIDVMESGASEADASREGDTANSSVGESTGSDQSYTSKDDRINKKVAFKEAAETLRKQESDVELNHGEHIEALAGLANGYYNILKDIGGHE